MATGRVPTTANSPLTAKGDLFTYDTNQARLAVGSNGDTLLADSAATTGLRWQASQAAGKNYCINGGFDIWQRSTSNGTTGYQTADRWYQIIAGTTTVSQSTDVPSAGQARYSAKITTSASSSYAQFQYSFEQADIIPLRGKTIVVSWYMKKNATWSGNFGVSNYYYSNSTDARASLATNVTAGYSNPTGATPTTSWARYYETITIPSDAVGFQKQWNPAVAQASGAELYIANVQFEIGSVPTSFTRSGGTLAGELAACYRYYQRVQVPNGGEGIGGMGFAAGTTIFDSRVIAPVPFRTAPHTLEYADVRVYNGANYSGGTLAFQGTRPELYTLRYTHGSAVFTTGTGGYFNAAAANAYIGVSAEL